MKAVRQAVAFRLQCISCLKAISSSTVATAEGKQGEEREQEEGMKADAGRGLASAQF